MDLPHYDLGPRIGPHEFEKYTCLDIGCGHYDSAVARQVLGIPWKKLTSIDIYEPYVKRAEAHATDAQEHECIVGDVMKLDARKKYDFIMAFDIIEHLKKKDSLALLKKLDKIAKKKIVIFVPCEPKGFHRVWKGDDNVHQAHLSHWTKADLKKLGYDAELLEDVHSELDPDTGEYVKFGAIWATKEIK